MYEVINSTERYIGGDDTVRYIGFNFKILFSSYFQKFLIPLYTSTSDWKVWCPKETVTVFHVLICRC